MKAVTLYDVKMMGKKGGYTLQFVHHFPFSVGLGRLKKDCIEFKRVGFIEGRPQEIILREPYSRDVLPYIKSIKHHQDLVAYRYKDRDLLFTKKEAGYVL